MFVSENLALDIKGYFNTIKQVMDAVIHKWESTDIQKEAIYVTRNRGQSSILLP